MKHIHVTDNQGRRAMFWLDQVSHFVELEDGGLMIVTKVGILYSLHGLAYDSAISQILHLNDTENDNDGINLVADRVDITPKQKH